MKLYQANGDETVSLAKAVKIVMAAGEEPPVDRRADAVVVFEDGATLTPMGEVVPAQIHTRAEPGSMAELVECKVELAAARAGWKTSEFWKSLAVSIAGVYLIVRGVEADKSLWIEIGCALAGVSTGVYTLGRSLMKRGK